MMVDPNILHIKDVLMKLLLVAFKVTFAINYIQFPAVVFFTKGNF